MSIRLQLLMSLYFHPTFLIPLLKMQFIPLVLGMDVDTTTAQ